MEINVDVAIIGSGTAGLNAMGQVRKAGKSFVLMNGGEAGTTCARVGCMPSKAMIQVAEDFHRKHIFDRHAIEGHEQLNLDMVEAMEHVRDMRDIFVDRVLANSTDNLGDEFIEEYAEFVEPGVLKAGDKIIKAKNIIIATGSTPIIPQQWQSLDSFLMTTDEFFEQESFPDSMAVIGLGVIGLELGQSLSRMGVKVSGFDIATTIGGLADPQTSEQALQLMQKEFPLYLGHAVSLSKEGDQIKVTAGDNEVVVDKVLLSMGRRPNLDRLKLENAGVLLDERGLPKFNNNTMQIEDKSLFIAGDVDGILPILHEAGDDGKIAGYNASHEQIVAFKRKPFLAITFCDPNIVSVGQPYNELDLENTVIGEMKMGPVGRALIMGQNKGTIRVYIDKTTAKVLGATMVTTRGENLAHLLAWAIQQEMTVFDMLQMPFYHPVIEEALQAALYNAVSQLEVKPDSPIMELRTL